MDFISNCYSHFSISLLITQKPLSKLKLKRTLVPSPYFHHHFVWDSYFCGENAQMCDENKDWEPCALVLSYWITEYVFFFFSNSPASEWLFSGFGTLLRGIQHSSSLCIYVGSILSTGPSYAVSNILLPRHLTIQRLESLLWTKWTHRFKTGPDRRLISWTGAESSLFMLVPKMLNGDAFWCW